jgi:MFS family permease
MAALRLDNLWVVYIVLTISGLGIGGIVVPASIITTIICPDELIATVAALTLSIRVLGGAVGYSIYFNVFAEHFTTEAVARIPPACIEVGIQDPTVIAEVIGLTAAGLLDEIRLLPNVTTEAKWEILVRAGQEAYSHAYPNVYYVSIAFGCVSIICSLFLKDVRKYMTDHVAVHMDELPDHRVTEAEMEAR